MKKEEFLQSGLLEQYVLGLTSESECALVEQYAEEYPEIQEAIDQMRLAMEQYMESQDIGREQVHELAHPRPSVSKSASSQSHNLPFRFIFFLGIVAIMAALTALANQRAKTLQSNREELVAAYSQCQRYSHELEQELVPVNQLSELKQQPDTRTERLFSIEDSMVTALIYTNKRLKKNYIQILDIPVAPDYHHYKLWAVCDSTFYPICSFRNPEFEKVHQLDCHTGAHTFFITTEKAKRPLQPSVQQTIAIGEHTFND